MKRGYVKIWRKITDSKILYDSGLCQLALWLLLNCNHEDGYIYGVKVGPGQIIIGRTVLSSILNVSGSTLYYRLKSLERLKFISIKASNKHTVITINNWDTYNGKCVTTPSSELTAIRQQPSNKLASIRQQPSTNKNDKNERMKECKNISYDSPSGSLQKQITDLWFRMHEKHTGEKPVYIKTGKGNYPLAFKKLSELQRPLHDYERVFENAFGDQFHRNVISPAYAADKFNELLVLIPRGQNNVARPQFGRKDVTPEFLIKQRERFLADG